MSTASFLLRAGISLAILSALPLFAKANAAPAVEATMPVSPITAVAVMPMTAPMSQ